MRIRTVPSASTFGTLLRFTGWLIAAARFGARLGWDRVKGRRSPRDRGIRLRELFEEMGGTAIKLGQQLAVRVDLLPLEICDELGKLMDQVPPFDVRYAIERIEAQCGKSLDEVFEAFDPEPIGSASIACVYQARLRNGEPVAVKVQRPAVARQFAWDLRSVDWLTYIPEALTLVKPGFFKYLRSELRSMLIEELDFNEEARYQRLFRLMMKKDRIKWASAPKIYKKYSGSDVIVSRFVSGIWCKELLAAVEGGNEGVLAQLREMGIKPKKVAKRLGQIYFYGMFEAPFFHADPHPANIVIQPGSKVVLLDFGSCGTLPSIMRRSMKQIMQRMQQDDSSGMAEAALQMLTPLPRVDLYELRKRIEDAYQSFVLATKDPLAEWWERTTVALWLGVLNVSRDMNLPVNRDVMRFFRASLLYDTLIFRIAPKIDGREGFRHYQRKEARRSARRRARLAASLSPQEQRDQWNKLLSEGLARAGRAAGQIEAALANLPIEVSSAIDKGAYAANVIVNLGTTVFSLLFLTSLSIVAYLKLSGQGVTRESLRHILWEQVLTSPISIVLLVVLAWLSIRRIMFRLNDIDPDKRL